MVYRLSWLAGIVGIVFALARAERLLRASAEGLPWEAILVVSAILGGAITWAGVAYRVRGWIIVVANVVAIGLTAFRIAVPQTTWFLFPTADSFTAIGSELAFARDVIRSGIAPVIPLSGIVAILAIVFWGMGALLAWGLLVGRPYIAVVTPLVVYLEFAVMDRRPGGSWTTMFMAVIGFALVAVALDKRRDGTGLLTSGSTRRTVTRSLPSMGMASLVVTLGLALVTAETVSGLVPRSGILDWRSGSGLSGEYFGSVSYNPFVGIRQQLISQTNVPVFVATVEGDLGPGEVYWRMVTLDSFDGTQWHIGGDPDIDSPEELDQFESAGNVFAGDTASVTSLITVLALQQDWLPAPYAPSQLLSDNNAVSAGFRVKTDDASLRFDALTYRGMTYLVQSEVPMPDLGVLGRLANGTPSIVFRGAIASGDFVLPELAATQPEDRELANEDRYLDLPDDLDSGIRALALASTRNLETDFERALALEQLFLAPGSFRYSTSILPGHGATDLADWLLDPESDNYRTGYCEQFSTAMGVMARLLGIPSRVVLGFSPGTVLEDGRVVVRDRNAHAWVELWMPSQGWVRFDPTPRGDTVGTSGEIPFNIAAYLEVPEQEAPDFEAENPGPVIFRDDEEIDVPTTPSTLPDGSDAGSLPLLPGWLLPAGAIVLGVFGLVPAMKWLRRSRRLRRLATGDISAAWREIVDRLTDLGEAPHPATTPTEVAANVDTALYPLAAVYSEATYGPGPIVATRLAIATRSLEDTEAGLANRYSLGHRLLSRYRLASLTPDWWRAVRRRRKR